MRLRDTRPQGLKYRAEFITKDEERDLVANIDAVERQQVAGLIMWVPAGIILVVPGLARFTMWLGEAERRVAVAALRGGRSGLPAPRFLAALGMTCVLLACKSETGDATHGQQLIADYGCASCHKIPGIKGPKGAIGPSLAGVGARPVIARKVQNTPQNMSAWLQNPQAFDPGNAMPNLNVKPEDARDITAYLMTLK